MSDEIAISFAGPFSWFGASNAPAVYRADEVRQCGIYLWTVHLPQGYLIYYVGETGGSFKVRLRQHYEELRIRRRIEAIAQTLSAAQGIIGAFQDKGIRYEPRVKAEQPIPCVVRSALPLLGLSERFFA